MQSSFNLLVALRTLDAATARVIPSLLTNPPPPAIEFYYTYIALNPLVTHFYTTLLFITLSPPIALFAASSCISSPYQCLTTILTTALYTLHPYLAQDNRTYKNFDSRLLIITSMIFLYTARCLFQEADPSFCSKKRSMKLQEKAEVTNRLKRMSYWLSKIIGFGYHVGLSSMLLTPIYFVWLKRGLELSWYDVAITIIGLIGIARIRRGTCTYAHFRGKIMFWFAMYMYTFAVGAPILNWTIFGLFLYVVELWTTGRFRLSANRVAVPTKRKSASFLQEHLQRKHVVEEKKDK